MFWKPFLRLNNIVTDSPAPLCSVVCGRPPDRSAVQITTSPSEPEAYNINTNKNSLQRLVTLDMTPSPPPERKESLQSMNQLYAKVHHQVHSCTCFCECVYRCIPLYFSDVHTYFIPSLFLSVPFSGVAEGRGWLDRQLLIEFTAANRVLLSATHITFIFFYLEITKSHNVFIFLAHITYLYYSRVNHIVTLWKV